MNLTFEHFQQATKIVDEFMNSSELIDDVMFEKTLTEATYDYEPSVKKEFYQHVSSLLLNVLYNNNDEYGRMGEVKALMGKMVCNKLNTPIRLQNEREFNEKILELYKSKMITSPPKPPLSRIIREHTIGDCPKCGSTQNKNHHFLWWNFGRIIGCINPDCNNYYKKNIMEKLFENCEHHTLRH